MGWRFRRSVKLFPGVRLNFTRGGLSTTIGVPGASINIGKSGPYLNLGLPGTGLSYRERLLPGRPPQQSLPAPLQSPPQGPRLVTTPPEEPKPGEIRSAAVSGMTSTGLEELKRLINEAAMRRVTLVRDVAQSERQIEETKERLHKAQRFLVRLFMQKRIPRLAREVQEASAKLAEERAELAACEIAIDFEFDDATLNAFAALVRAYESLQGCAAIWDITNSVVANRKVLRTAADEVVNRTPVRLEFGSSAIINSKYQALVLGNANGQDIYIYPGFVMMRSPGQDFALIDVRDLVLELRLSRFFEEEQVPSDSEVIDYTWAKTNRDGSPDRRFRENYQIPVVQYAQLWFRSPTGLQEAYLISNFGTTEAFAVAFREYQAALKGLAERSKNSTQQDLPETWPAPEEEPGAEIEELPPAPVVSAKNLDDQHDAFWREALLSGVGSRKAFQAKYTAFCNSLQAQVSHLPQDEQDKLFMRLVARNAEYISLGQQDREALKIRLGVPVRASVAHERVKLMLFLLVFAGLIAAVFGLQRVGIFPGHPRAQTVDAPATQAGAEPAVSPFSSIAINNEPSSGYRPVESSAVVPIPRPRPSKN